jgi:hypothetical protein
MPTLLGKVHPEDCAYLAMITGPSRTADIERVLTIGVHGPERLVIVFVDEMGGSDTSPLPTSPRWGEEKAPSPSGGGLGRGNAGNVDELGGKN